MKGNPKVFIQWVALSETRDVIGRQEVGLEDENEDIVQGFVVDTIGVTARRLAEASSTQVGSRGRGKLTVLGGGGMSIEGAYQGSDRIDLSGTVFVRVGIRGGNRTRHYVRFRWVKNDGLRITPHG